MTEALVLPFVKQGAASTTSVATATVAADVGRRPEASPSEDVAAVEIVAPDGYSAARLQEYAAPFFRAEIVGAPGWVVRFHPPGDRDDWVVELFALVERWLKAVPLPCAKAMQDGRNYLIRTVLSDPPAAKG
jgi:hypothetical protein